MIGNDVVDLPLALQGKHWKNRRFLDKLFSEKEKHTIFNSENKPQTIWLLWSMKEAAYKAHQRHFNLKRFYNPTFFKCFIEKSSQKKVFGNVLAANCQYFTQSTMDFDKIHTIASVSEEIDNKNELFESTSAEMKANFLQQFSNLKNEEEQFSLQYNQHKIPQLYKNNEALELSFSFSHHGRFSAYACALNNF